VPLRLAPHLKHELWDNEKLTSPAIDGAPVVSLGAIQHLDRQGKVIGALRFPLSHYTLEYILGGIQCVLMYVLRSRPGPIKPNPAPNGATPRYNPRVRGRHRLPAGRAHCIRLSEIVLASHNDDWLCHDEWGVRALLHTMIPIRFDLIVPCLLLPLLQAARFLASPVYLPV
jgi:hypothetical protein